MFKLTSLKVIENELKRLHKEADSYTLNGENEEYFKCYNRVLDEISKINNTLLEMAKDEAIWG